MSIDTSLLAANYIQNRLTELSHIDAESAVNEEFSGSNGDIQKANFRFHLVTLNMFCLKILLTNSRNIPLVQISNAALQQVSDYLVQIKDKVAQMESSLQDDSARIQLSSELEALENELSTYLSMSIQSASRGTLI